VRVEVDEQALKDLEKIEKKRASQILSKIERLVDFPRVANFKKLTNFYPPYRLRVGDYRVLFDVVGDEITVYRVKHRKESYR
jgi:mRNA interferase RelE/StbE